MSINPLKEFFKRKKAEVKFSRAGPGQKLSSEPSGSTTSASAKEAAAEAAMKRFNKQASDKPTQKPRIAPASSQESTHTSVSNTQEKVQDKNAVRKELPVVEGNPLRDIQVFTKDELAQRTKQVDIDDEFFKLTVEDAKLFKQRYDEQKATNEILRTSEMRKREAEAKKPTTNIARLRFKLPNNKILEASFSGRESLRVVKEWLEEHAMGLAGLKLVNYDLLFGLRPFKESDYAKSLRELNMIPATTLTVVLKPL